MRRLSILLACSAALAVAACDNTKRLSEPTPTPTLAPGRDVQTGGPCGDGTVLKPDQHCP